MSTLAKRNNPALPVYRDLDALPEGLKLLKDMAAMRGIKPRTLSKTVRKRNIFERGYWKRPDGRMIPLYREKDLEDETRKIRPNRTL